uniref:Uncharacterized protein n=1 Tax=Romanomermis culicivorax TaxID=13658 RepID=A0A915L9T8_ROMCU
MNFCETVKYPPSYSSERNVMPPPIFNNQARKTQSKFKRFCRRTVAKIARGITTLFLTLPKQYKTPRTFRKRAPIVADEILGIGDSRRICRLPIHSIGDGWRFCF